jgi:glycosyltransferase involved in cell wall biosynthesis
VTRFQLVINCGPCEDFIGQCLESVLAQSHTEWIAHVTVDPCGDATFEKAVHAARGDSRIRVHRNSERHYSLRNLVDAIARSGAEPEDVIAALDGDDWFATPQALSIVADAYESHGCWMTYGSWLSNVPAHKGLFRGLWPAYPEDTTDFRRSPWRATAVRTWKKWLWDRIDDADLRNASGEYFRVAEDQVVMLPMLEMSGTAKARHIPEPIMVYNKTVRYAVSEEIEAERQNAALLIDTRLPYRRLSARAVSGATEGARCSA